MTSAAPAHELGLQRTQVIETLARLVPHPGTRHRPVRVAVDGVDGAGKTTLADELADALRRLGRVVVRVSVDGFHQPRCRRYARGRNSGEGYFLDSYDYDRFIAEVLAPLGPGGSRTLRRAAYDVVLDCPVEVADERVPEDVVLVVDGIFLHRDELAPYWEWSVFLSVGADEALARMAARDGFTADPDDPTQRRYLDGQRRYLAQCLPESRASVVVVNTPLARPAIRAHA